MSKLTLLIADDVEMNRSVIKKLLGRDFNVLEAENGIQALDAIEKNKVDVVILDIVMPEMNGIEVLEKVRSKSEWNALGILVATSQKEQTERLALASGADDVVAKPYDPIVIKQRINNILAKKELDKMEAEDVKGISGEDRRKVDHTLFELKDTCKLVKENETNPDLMDNFIDRMNTDIEFLIDLLTTREGY